MTVKLNFSDNSSIEKVNTALTNLATGKTFKSDKEKSAFTNNVAKLILNAEMPQGIETDTKLKASRDALLNSALSLGSKENKNVMLTAQQTRTALSHFVSALRSQNLIS